MTILCLLQFSNSLLVVLREVVSRCGWFVPCEADSELEISMQIFIRESLWSKTCEREGTEAGLGRRRSQVVIVSIIGLNQPDRKLRS